MLMAAMMEICPQASLQQLRADWQTELRALKAEVEHRRRLVAHKIKARQEEEDIKVRTTMRLRVTLTALHFRC